MAKITWQNEHGNDFFQREKSPSGNIEIKGKMLFS